MVIVSTADSLLCSISSNFAFDFSLLKKTNKVRFSQLITLAIGISSVFVSFYMDKVVSLFMISYEFSVSVLFVSTIAALFSKKLPKKAALLSMCCGMFGFIFFKFYKVALFSEVITLSFSLLGFLIAKKIYQTKEISE
jgi:Na+/pantothenate symporter